MFFVAVVVYVVVVYSYMYSLFTGSFHNMWCWLIRSCLFKCGFIFSLPARCVCLCSRMSVSYSDTCCLMFVSSVLDESCSGCSEFSYQGNSSRHFSPWNVFVGRSLEIVPHVHQLCSELFRFLAKCSKIVEVHFPQTF